MRRSSGVLRLVAAGTPAAVALLIWGQALGAVEGLMRQAPQPAAEDLAPGLAVTYYFNYFRHVREITEWAKYKDGKAGPPIPALDYQVGEGNVLTSGQADAVGAHITGLINLDKTGTYTFAVQSNDGIRVEIGGKLILQDPEVHADRYSDAVEVKVSEAGWYPLDILYFERKNTSTIELYWLTPDDEAGTMTLVPASVFARPKSP